MLCFFKPDSTTMMKRKIILFYCTLSCAVAHRTMEGDYMFSSSNETSVVQIPSGAGARATWPMMAGIGLTAVGATGAMMAMSSSIGASAAAAATPAALGMVSGTAAANSAMITTAALDVATVSHVTAPTIALANTIGVAPSAISSLALAGSLLGPVLGVILIVYLCWPPKKEDSFAKVEVRMQQLINDRFDRERAHRLGNRLKRYVRDFSRCSGSWLDRAQSCDGSDEVDESEVGVHTPICMASPPCMAELEGHMSVERDEWMDPWKNSLDMLFMPFANLHTQTQALLKDYPTRAARYYNWDLSHQDTSAEYAAFLANRMFSGWKSHVCRTVRLRYSKNGVASGWKYFLTVLQPEWQPNADGKDCLAKSGDKTGWSNYCGGQGVGACCKGDPATDMAVCSKFDVPSTRTSRYHACVHTDCSQSNSVYARSTELGRLEMGSLDWAACQGYCRDVHPGADIFSIARKYQLWASMGGYVCKCQRREDSTYRLWKAHAFSGPRDCPSTAGDDKPVQSDEEKMELPNVPMKEVRPCPKSPPVSNVQQLENEQWAWQRRCYKDALRYTMADFNPYYRRFVPFLDQLTAKAGCWVTDNGTIVENATNDTVTNKSKIGWDTISDRFNFANFYQCDWAEEEPADTGAWHRDREARSGWLGLSKIDMDEQKQMRLAYPLPAWLESRRKAYTCLVNKKPSAAATGTSKDKVDAVNQFVARAHDEDPVE